MSDTQKFLTQLAGDESARKSLQNADDEAIAKYAKEKGFSIDSGELQKMRTKHQSSSHNTMLGTSIGWS